MWATLLGWLLKSKAIKAGAGAVGGSGLLALIFSLHTDVTTKIEKVAVERKEYIELVLKPLEVKINNLKDSSNETKQMVRDIHAYLLDTKKKNNQ